MWKNGRTAMTRSSGADGIAPSVWATLATRFLWVSMTPLDSPVVPEECEQAGNLTKRPARCAGSGVAGRHLDRLLRQGHSALITDHVNDRALLRAAPLRGPGG